MGMLNLEFLNLKNATIKGLSTAFYNEEKNHITIIFELVFQKVSNYII